MALHHRSLRLSLESLECRRVLASGDLDLSFGDGGKVLSLAGDHPRYGARDVAVQLDGKILVTGERPNGEGSWFALRRYDTSGVLDPTFGDNGLVTGEFGVAEDILRAGESLFVQTDGKIVVAADNGLARFNSDGSPDTSFSGDGKFVTPENSFDGKDVAVQNDGKIVVASDAVVHRFHSNGTLDTSFSEDGVAELALLSQQFPTQGANALALQPDGKIVVAGAAKSRGFFAAWRLNADGTPDATFTGDGAELFPARTNANAVVVQPDGKIILAGRRFFEGQMAVLRLLPNGELDSSFSGDGRAAVNFQTPNQNSLGDEANDVVLQGDGKIVIAGMSDLPISGSGNPKFAIARLNSNGSIDTTFHLNGKTEIDFQEFDSAVGMGLHNGKIIVGGVSATADFAVSIALARLDGSARPEDLNLGDNLIPENRPAGTVVGGFTTSDDDGGDSFTYSLVAGPGAANNAAFEIVGNQLRTRRPFNFEQQESYSVRVRTTDSFGNFHSESFLIQVTDVEEPFLLGGISGSIGYTLNAPSIWLAQTATLSDDGNADYNGGRLLVEITSGADPSNRLSFGGAFSLSGNNVVRDSVVIGQRTSDGVGTSALEITFNANATRAIVEQLAKSIRFRTVDGTTGQSRVVSYTVEDGDGLLSNTAAKTVNVSA